MKHLKGVNRNQIKKIEHPYLILCEGLDEKLFLIYYLEYLIKNNIISDDLFCVYDCGGNEAMRKNISKIQQLDGYNNVKGLYIIRDAESDVNAAIDSVKHIIRNILQGSPVNPGMITFESEGRKVIYSLLPGPDENGVWQNGTLEDLCWSITGKLPSGETYTEDSEMLGSIKELVYSHHKSVTTIRGIDFKRVHKNLLHLLMASTDTFVGLKPGEAAKAGAFDFSHHNLNFIRDALLALLKENK